ncbi:hypothetical protein AB1Y20_007653 [Prymnesium parvum]|uniref:Uncharacterized protein n=1 Tax=Prymnesium parvum TaxID=97485 RepID=A0AB34IVN2_PRYPA
MGWVKEGVPHLRTVPARLPPKNVVEQLKWAVDANGAQYRKHKWRVTTDDSIAPAGMPVQEQRDLSTGLEQRRALQRMLAPSASSGTTESASIAAASSCPPDDCVYADIYLDDGYAVSCDDSCSWRRMFAFTPGNSGLTS